MPLAARLDARDRTNTEHHQQGELMTRPLVYIASPITSDPWGCVRRAVTAAEVLEWHDVDAYLPQLSVLHEMIQSRSHREWVDAGVRMLARCDGMWRLPGESAGADLEEAEASRLGLPLLHMESHAVGVVPDVFSRWLADVRMNNKGN